MKKAPEVAQLVVMNHEPGATMYRVTARNAAWQVGLIDATIEDKQPNQRVQWVDISLVEPPTVGQLAEFNQ